MADRREALKIIGAIGSTCAFPFSADELYAQHSHPPGAQAEAGAPRVFDEGQMQLVSRLADLIIPADDTPGALSAGVPAYIDLVVSRNGEMQQLMQTGLDWLDQEAQRRFGSAFLRLPEPRQIALLEPLCEAADAGQTQSAGERFFRAFKNLTADGYYTSKAGLVEDLGYQGNTVMGTFPSCEVPEH